MATAAQIHGHCDPRFTAVREAFAANFAGRGEVGAAVCVYVEGKPVVDLWGGYADAARTRPWDQHTIVNVASTTKGMVALCTHMLVERGLLDLDAPVARYWPEFAQADKAHIPVRWLLSHRAGLPAIRRDMPPQSLYDWHAFTAALEKTTPWWEPGTQHGYHAMAFGYLVGEVIRRVSGRTVGQFLREEVTTPLGADFFLGVPAAEHARLADIVPEPLRLGGGTTFWETILREPQSMVARAFFNPWRTITSMNTRAWRAAEIPAANGHTTARALARIYGALAQGGTLDGVRLLHPATIDAAIVEQSSGPDAVLSCQTRFGLGFMLTKPEQTSACALGIPRVGPNARAFGHPGFGGSIGFADPDVRLGFGYVTNFYRTGTRQDPDLRRECLIKAAYASLGVR